MVKVNYKGNVVLRFVPLKKRSYRQSCFELSEQLDVEVNGQLYQIPQYFKTDGASIPRALWWFASPFNGNYVPAAIVHDYFYRHSYSAPINRQSADHVFYRLMIQDGVHLVKANIMYYAVRAFGWLAWGRNKSKYR